MGTDVAASLGRFTVGDLEIEVGLQRVTRAGVEVPLPKLSFDLLLVLAEAAPNVVSHAELLRRVWPGLVVADKTVNQRVKLLRDALGDDSESPRYIAGLRSRGYRIIAPVTQARGAGAAPNEQPAAAPPALPARRRTTWAAAALAATAGIALATAWSLRPPVEIRNTAAGAAVTPTPRIAVLPFRAGSGAADDAFIGTGLAEAVLERLASIEGLDTIARDSAFRFAGSELTTDEIARRLGADFVLEGQVRRDGDTLHVQAQLTDAAADRIVWSSEIAGNVAEIFDTPQTVASEAAGTLQGRQPARTPVARPRPTENVDAYLAYLRGRASLADWTIVDAREAERAFATAIALDPEFADAHAALYEARLLAADRAAGGAAPNAAAAFLGPSPLETLRRDNAHLVERAIVLDPDCGSAYFARAIWAAKDSAEREEDFRRGLKLDPSNGRGIVAYSEYLDRSNRPVEAERMLTRALAIDPLSPRAHFRRVMRKMPIDPTERVAGMARVLEIEPDYQPALQRYGKYRWMFFGEMAEAARTLERALELDRGNPWIAHTAVAIYLDLGDVATASARAAATQRPEIAGQLLLDLYRGDVAAAGAAAYEDAAFASGRDESWGVYEAVLEWALATGDLQRAVDYIEQRSGLEPAREPSVQNFRAVPAAAQLLTALGRTDEARQLLMQTIHWIDTYHLPNLATIYALRIKATALALLGEDDLALDALDASFRGNDYLQWWYTLDRDPAWTRLRADARFTAIATRVRAHVDQQSALLATLRQQGLVPSM